MLPDACGDVVAAGVGAAVAVFVGGAGQGDAQFVVAQVTGVGVGPPGEVQVAGRQKFGRFLLFAAKASIAAHGDVGF